MIKRNKGTAKSTPVDASGFSGVLSTTDEDVQTALETIDGGGGGSNDVWYDITGTYASADTFTFSGDEADSDMIIGSLFTCLSSGDARRVGYVKSASHAGGTVTVTVKCVEIGDLATTGLESGDKNFKISFSNKIHAYRFHIYVPNETVADASNWQGNILYLREAAYLLGSDVAVVTPAAGTGAACAVNFYEDSTALYSSAIDLSTNESSLDNIPSSDNALAANTHFSMRVTSVGGDTNLASDLTADCYIVPQDIFNGGA